MIDLPRGGGCERKRADGTIIRARVDLAHPTPNKTAASAGNWMEAMANELTLCESTGSNFTAEIDDFEVAGQ
jgi:uncharacterized lipoprotein NlpE involved in copper resistance